VLRGAYLTVKSSSLPTVHISRPSRVNFPAFANLCTIIRSVHLSTQLNAYWIVSGEWNVTGHVTRGSVNTILSPFCLYPPPQAFNRNINAINIKLIKCYAMKTWWSGDTAPPFVTSALDIGEWSASRPGPFTFCAVAPGTHWLYAYKLPYTLYIHTYTHMRMGDPPNTTEGAV
jgi:hypothetical protein